MWIGSHARAPNVAWNWRICASPSPEAVGSRQIRGIGTPASAEHVVVERGVLRLHAKPPPPMARIVGALRGGKRDRRPFAEIGGLQRQFDDVVADGLDPVCARSGRESTTRCRSSPTKCSAAPSDAA